MSEQITNEEPIIVNKDMANNKKDKSNKGDGVEMYKIRKMNIYNEDINKHYPHKFQLSHNHIDELIAFTNLYKEGEKDINNKVSFAGRIILKRPAGKNLCFYTLQKDGKIIQLASSKKEYQGDEFREINKEIHRGDIIGINGYMGKTHKGELTIFATKLQILTPCFHPLPKSNVGISNQETRYSNRHLDLVVNGGVRGIFEIRAKIINYLRSYLDGQGFLEVSTPVLTKLYGGASARPFVTHHNELKQDMYMRIAPELYLKKLVIGGIDRVYEIDKQFRNEGIDTTHNPEFTSLEYYQAYVDYNDLMNQTEIMISNMVKQINGSYKINYTNLNKETFELDFEPPYRKFNMITDLEVCLGEKIPLSESNDDETLNKFLIKHCDKHGIHCSEPKTNARLYDKLSSHFLEEKCINPTFLINHPRFMSPLAKWHRNNSLITERFELFVAKMEICNAYTELNHPKIQEVEFLKQVEAKNKGDLEAQEYDKSYIEALEFGLPPTGGFGMGIDRLVMLLTNNYSIREVILFPTM